jgi:ADP-ribose pyrophosphatase YjhB (NUDIX family)
MSAFIYQPNSPIMQWKPNTTVAAMIEQNGKFLMVEEQTTEGIRINQPAGHLENGESLTQAVIREANEETAYDFIPESLLGIYHWQRLDKEITYLRFAFIGKVGEHRPQQKLDAGILRAVWMSLDEIRASQTILRSPQVLQCVEDYLAGKRYPLEVVTHL